MKRSLQNKVRRKEEKEKEMLNQTCGAEEMCRAEAKIETEKSHKNFRWKRIAFAKV